MLREIALGLVLSMVPQWLAATYADTLPAADGERKFVLVKAIADPNDGSGSVLAPGGTVRTYAFGHNADDGDGGAADGKKEARVFAVANPSIDDKDDTEHGWLGVSIGSVPSALAAQLNTDEKGILILNVVKDSPADHAGLQVHDVILAINGRSLDGYKNAVDAIRAGKPGETITLRVVRDGQEQTLRAALISRAGQVASGFAWKFENAQD
ncbi:MAG: S1C family serine protease, partial [Thermoplasmata archaeon]